MPLLRLGHRLRWLALSFALRTSSLVVPAVVCGSFLGRRSCVFFLSSWWVRGCLLLASDCCLLLCLFLRHWRSFRSVSCRRLPLRGYATCSGSSCLSCTCGGALSIGFAVSLVRRLVFHLVWCFSCAACSFGQLPLPQVACLRVLPPYAWPATAPVASVGLQPSPCVLSASPVPVGLLGSLGSSPCVRELPWGL